MKIKIILTLIILIFNSYMYGKDFNNKDKAIIYQNSIDILFSFQNLINEAGNSNNNIDQIKNYSENLINLFINRKVLVYNDLDPAHQLSEFYEIETYISNLVLWYPDGIEIKLVIDSAKVSNIIEHEENVFSVDILIEKRINGNYNNMTFNKNSESLVFRIAFIEQNNSFRNFKIVGIRNALSNITLDNTLALQEMKGEKLSEKDLEKIYSSSKAVLSDYNNYLNLIGDTGELAEDKNYYVKSFVNLFEEPSSKVFNDLQPDPEKDWLNAEDYIRLYQALYTEGVRNIALNMDSVEYSKIIPINENSYYILIYVDKFFSGKYRQKEVFRNAVKLIFKVSFTKIDKVYKDFYISNIDRKAFEYFEQQSTTEGQDIIPSIKLKGLNRKGIYISPYLLYGQSIIKDKNIETQNITNNYHEWQLEPVYKFNGGINIEYFFNNHYAILSGFGLSQYSSHFKLDSYNSDSDTMFIDNNISYDINNEPYNKLISAKNFDSLVNLNYLAMPIQLKYLTSGPKKIGIYINAGINILLLIDANYKTIADKYSYMGYYESHPYFIQYLNFEELGFKERININEKGKIDLNKIIITGNISAGIIFPVGHFSCIYLGGKLLYGLTDIFNDRKEYINIFGIYESEEQGRIPYTSKHIHVNIKYVGLELGYSYKF